MIHGLTCFHWSVFVLRPVRFYGQNVLIHFSVFGFCGPQMEVAREREMKWFSEKPDDFTDIRGSAPLFADLNLCCMEAFLFRCEDTSDTVDRRTNEVFE